MDSRAPSKKSESLGIFFTWHDDAREYLTLAVTSEDKLEFGSQTLSFYLDCIRM